MQLTPKFTGNDHISTHLKSQNHLESLKVTHLKTRQVFQKKIIQKNRGEGGHINTTPPPHPGRNRVKSLG